MYTHKKAYINTEKVHNCKTKISITYSLSLEYKIMDNLITTLKRDCIG